MSFPFKRYLASFIFKDVYCERLDSSSKSKNQGSDHPTTSATGHRGPGV